MAKNQGTTNDQGLLFNENASGRYATGTKAELVGTLKFKPEWFPGAKGNHKTSMTIEGDKLLSIELDPTIVKLQIDRSAEGHDLFDVAMLYSDEEEERRSYIHAKEFEVRAYKEASDLAKRWINGMPTSVENFKKRSAQHINQGIGVARGSYSFDKKTVREFDLAVDALCNILLNGKVNFYEYGDERQRREYATDAFNRGLSLSFTGHQRNALVERFLTELVASEAGPEAVTA